MKKPEASLAIQILPKVEDSRLLDVVDTVIKYIEAQNLNAFVAPFETTIEGDLDTLMEVAKECQKICIREGANGVSAYMKFTYNPDNGVYSIEEKTDKYKK